MFCTKCGAMVKDGAVFCTSCGTKVSTTEKPRTIQPQNQKKAPQSNGTNKKKLILFIVFGIAILILVVVLFFFWFGRKDIPVSADDDWDVVEQEQVTTPDEVRLPAKAKAEAPAKEREETPAEAPKGEKPAAEPVIEAEKAREEDVAPDRVDNAETESMQQETEMPIVLNMTQGEVEEEVLRIRQVWTTDREAITNESFDVNEPQTGIKIYSSANDIQMIEVKSKIFNDYNMTFQVENGKLTFAYYESKKAQIRLYYKDEKLFRWIQTNAGKDAVIHDLEHSNEEFLNNGQMALNDFYKVMNNFSDFRHDR